MKQTIVAFCLIVVLLVLSKTSFGQKNILVGVQGGISIPNLTAGSNNNPFAGGWSYTLGADYGMVASFKVKRLFSIQVELNYSSQGGKKNGPQAVPVTYFDQNASPSLPAVLYANLNSETKIKYFQLPVLAKFSLPINSGLHFFADAGPYVGLMVSAKTIANGTTAFYTDAAETQPLAATNGQSFTINVNEDVRSNIKHVNVGIQGGIGLQQKLFVGFLTLTAGGNYGFIPIQRNAGNGQNNTGAATLKIGYLINM